MSEVQGEMKKDSNEGECDKQKMIEGRRKSDGDAKADGVSWWVAAVFWRMEGVGGVGALRS